MIHLINILLISLFFFLFFRLLRLEMLFVNLGYFIERYFGRFFGKPFGLCVPCSASVIGSIAYLLLIVSGFTQYSIWMHIFYMVACVNLNPILWFLTEFLIIFTNKIRKDLENKK